jgi:hypothetical protein
VGLERAERSSVDSYSTTSDKRILKPGSRSCAKFFLCKTAFHGKLNEKFCTNGHAGLVSARQKACFCAKVRAFFEG